MVKPTFFWDKSSIYIYKLETICAINLNTRVELYASYLRLAIKEIFPKSLLEISDDNLSVAPYYPVSQSRAKLFDKENLTAVGKMNYPTGSGGEVTM